MKIIKEIIIIIIIIQQDYTYPDAGYPDRLAPSGKFVENSKKKNCLALKLPVIGSSTV